MGENENKGVSLLPEHAMEGGYLDDANVTFKTVRAVTWDYRGKAEPCAAIEVVMIAPDGKEKPEYYRVGKLTQLVPSGNGLRFLPVGSATGIMKGTKGFHLITSIINAGFPTDKIGQDLNVFDGLRAHINNTTLPKFKDNESGEEKDNKALLVTKILALPWENKGAGAGAGTSAAGKKATAAASSTPATPAASSTPADNDALSQKAVEQVTAAVEASGGSITRIKLQQQVFRQLSQDNDRNAVIKLLTPDFLKGLDGQPVEVGGEVKALAFDGTTLSFAA